ncbi:MAG: PilZ domain [Pseudomonadota bacterium]|jgi:c-di-GMP-binding flagellar brake protein YcgR
MSIPARKPSFAWKRAPVADRRAVIRLSAGTQRWDVRMVGLMTRSRFLVSHPTTDEGKLVFVKEGEGFGVSTFDGAVISAFDSTVQRVVLGEAPGLEMSLPPAEMRRRETVRHARRATVSLPCSIRYGSAESELRAGFTGDLSETGAQVAIERPLPMNVKRVDVSLRIAVLGDPITLQVRAAIRSQTPDPRPDVVATLLGLEFENTDQTVRLSLGHYVRERLLAEADDLFGAVR